MNEQEQEQEQARAHTDTARQLARLSEQLCSGARPGHVDYISKADAGAALLAISAGATANPSRKG